MYNIISFAEIKRKSSFWNAGKFSISRFLPNHQYYFAHQPKAGSPFKAKETLEEHLTLVTAYFFKLLEAHSLEAVIDKLIQGLIPEHLPDKKKVADFIKTAFLHVIVYHDFGKVNHLFQKERMDNANSAIPVIQHNFKHQHSALGAYLFAIHHYSDNQFLDGEVIVLTDYIITLFTYPILKHHSSVLLCPFDNINMQSEADYFRKYLSHFNKQIADANWLETFQNRYIKQCSDNLRCLFDGEQGQSGLQDVLNDNFPLYALIKLSFSLLTAADYLATNAYSSSISLDEQEDLGTLSATRIYEVFNFVANAEWLDQAREKKNYNQNTYKVLNDYQYKNPKKKNNISLNILRQEMAIAVIRNIREHADKNLFYIEAPTGGGKTNLSMLAAIELLKASPTFNKVFYVFPFTTLITQTHQSLVQLMNLQPTEIVQLHSKAGFHTKEEAEDGEYGNNKKNYIDNLFVNFPFCLLTHIKFFDILKTNEKETNYILHRLANSIVIIDELQSYNPAHWDKLIYFIRNYAHYFNIKFILMSATLPKLDKLEIIKDKVNDFIYLLPDAQQAYFNNPNFKNRVRFNFDLFARNDLSLEELAAIMLEKSKQYAIKDFNSAKPAGSVYTIIEFIFKKTATQFHEIINNLHQGYFDEIFLLSGTILEHRRKYIIEYLKNAENRKKRILLITTQVVEAGVDIDMDLGFKDRSLIDGDEQLAGRINRNVNKEDCELYLFNYDREGIIYGKDKRYEVMRKINITDYKEILDTKNFDHLYNKVLESIYEWNNKSMAIGFKDYEDLLKRLKFQTVHEEFKLIDQKNISCFVPLSIPCHVGSHPFFSKTELKFLSQHKVYPNQEEKIEGAAVFDIYLKFIEQKSPDFIDQKIANKILQGIMSRYIFSLFANDKVERQLIHFSDPDKSQFGYKYLNRWTGFYDEERGMRDIDFNSNETQFL